MSKPDRKDGAAMVRCPECGVSLRWDDKRCDFCGRKLSGDAPADAVRPSAPRRSPLSRAGGLLAAAAAAVLLVAALVHFGRDVQAPDAPPAAPGAPPPDPKRLAYAACEGYIRRQVRAPFRVIAFRSGLVADESPGYVVTGTVELQSTEGALERKRYWCKARPDAGTGIVVDGGGMR